MTKSRVLLAGALLAAAGAANADITVPIAVVSDYDFRGLTQTEEDPALQAGLTWTADSGFYAGLWGSNVSFPGTDGDIEIDAFVGFAGGDAAESFGYDIGAIYYTYPGSDDLEEVLELYAGITKGVFGFKLWYSPDNYDEDSFYTEANATFPIGDSGFSIPVHVGYSFGGYWEDIEYVDYSVGLNYAYKAFTFGLKWVDTDIDGTDTGRVIGSISTTLPWASE